MYQRTRVHTHPQLAGLTQLGLGDETTSRYLHILAETPTLQPVLAQLERAIAIVPLRQRKRILGQLFGATLPHQTEEAIRPLLLALMLHGSGWEVTFEPEIRGLTPDLKIAHRNAHYFIEIKSLRDTRFDIKIVEFERLMRELSDLRTTSPLRLLALDLPGHASPRQAAEHIRTTLAGPPTERPISYKDVTTGVYVEYEFRRGPAVPYPGPVFLSPPACAHYLHPEKLIEKAVKKAAKAYNFPFILALHLDMSTPLETMRSALWGHAGTEVHFKGDEVSELRPTTSPNALFTKPNGRSAVRSGRVLGILPFSATVQSGAFELRAQLHWNPAASTQGQTFVVPEDVNYIQMPQSTLRGDGGTVVFVP